MCAVMLSGELLSLHEHVSNTRTCLGTERCCELAVRDSTTEDGRPDLLIPTTVGVRA